MKYETPGIWDDEPDSHSFIHAGMRCELRRGPAGAWCGYVGVPKEHPWFGRGYSEVVKGDLPEEATIDEIGCINMFCGAGKVDAANKMAPMDLLVPCHGGLTYAGKGSHIEENSEL